MDEPEVFTQLPADAITCGWRIVISPMIPQDSPSCYHSSMRNLAVLFIQSSPPWPDCLDLAASAL